MAALEGISAQGQEVADATGVAYQDIGNTEIPTYPEYDAEKIGATLESEAPIASGLDYVDEDKSTVAGQLNSLLNSESPYIQQARLAGEKQAASRGMLNSSMSAGASEAQAIQAAAPIAQQDAATYAKAQGMEQAAQNAQNQTQTEGIISSELNIQNAEIAQGAQNIQNKFTALMQGASEANTVLLQDMQNGHQEFMTGIEQDFNQVIQTEQISAQKADSIRQQSSAIMQNYQISVENMMTDPDFLNLGAAAVNNGINQMQQLARNSIKFLGASSGINLDNFVNAYLANIRVL